MGKPPAGIFWGARNMFTPAAQPIKTGSGPAGRLPKLNAGRYSISTGNVGIARSSWPTVIVINEGMRFIALLKCLIETRRFKSVPPTAPLGFASASEERGSAPGTVFLGRE